MKRHALVLGLIMSACLDCAGGDAVRTAPAGPAPRSTASNPSGAGRPSTPLEMTMAFTLRFPEAFAAHGAQAAGALFAQGAVLTLMGEQEEFHGRPAIEGALRGFFDRYSNTRLIVGRVWVGPAASAIEFVLGATRRAGKLMEKTAAARPVGLIGAAVVVFGADGLVTVQRIYLDVMTGMGQVSPEVLPPGLKVRPVASTAPDGSNVVVSTGTAAEAKNLAVTNEIWAAVDAHLAADAMLPCVDDYLYEDYAGPAPLKKAATQRMFAAFLKAIPDFRLTGRPVQIAAGDDVVSENLESGTFKGKPILFHALDVKRFRDAKVVKEWQYANQVEVFTQFFGMMPPTDGPLPQRP